MSIFRGISVTEEREYERKHIARQRDRYLSTDVLRKMRVDIGYGEKVHQIEIALGKPKGLVLDIGANTCGESECLTTMGYSVIATDINEVALGLSQERCAKFKRKGPRYLACDGHRLPIRDESIQSAVFNESLHHMYNPLQALREVQRVLIPGGRVYLYEPYAFDPYRRLSEIRDRLRGTIERSFGVSQLKGLLRRAGLRVLSVQRHNCVPSNWKMEVMNPIHKVLKRAYFAVSKACPVVFGNLMVLAAKPRNIPEANPNPSSELFLRCPVTDSRLLRVADLGYLSMDESFRGLYPSHQGIPILISQEARRLDHASWEALVFSPSSQAL